LLFALAFAACSKSNPEPSGASCSTQASSTRAVCAASDPAPSGGFMPLSGDNVLPVTVNSSCPAAATTGCAANVPFVSLTICTPGSTTQCQTIGNILLDTGSYGLRIFGSLITGATPTPYKISGDAIGECQEFGSANTWGSVQLYDVQLDGQTLSSFPIQQIDPSFEGGPPASSICAQMGSVSGPTDENANFNGILGVGLGQNDNGNYFSCASSGHCVPVLSGVPAIDQVQNPVPRLAVDNNGVLLEMPAIPAGGQSSVTGYLVFGIGTQSNNNPATWGVTNVFQTDLSFGFMKTTYNQQQFEAFIDSGSNAIYIPDCFASTNGFLTPSCAVNVTATNMSYSTDVSSIVPFQIGNANTLLGAGNWAFNNLSGTAFDYPGIGDVFDWGLPFFYGRTVFVGIAGKSAGVGVLGNAEGPYWAY
jgi:hypothetical protein